MMYKNLYEDLVKILTNVVENNIYGSVEIFFEKGKVTQITQRIIKKVQNINKSERKEDEVQNRQHTID